MEECSHRFGVLILAAGASRRMGEPKALLPWGQGTVLEHHLHVWASAGVEQVAVVMDPQNTSVRKELGRLNWEDVILNHHPEAGMMSSLRAAASWSGWAAGLEHVVVVLVDQPQLPLVVARELVDLAAGHPQDVCQPQYADRRGHPVLLPWKVFMGIVETTSGTLRDYLRLKEAPRQVLVVTDPGWMEDMDTRDAYQSLRDRYDRQD